MSPIPDGFLTIREACAILGVHHNTLRRWIWRGKLLAYQPGRAYLIPREALERFILENRVVPRDPSR